MTENPPRYDPPSGRSTYFILHHRKAYAVFDLLEWADWYERADRTVRKSYIGEYFISTVFLGLDHSFFDGPPLLFETMIFKTSFRDDLYQTRCTTWRQALKMHRTAKEYIRGIIND